MRWLGFHGLSSGRLLLLLSCFADRDGALQILVLHAGGNDLSSVPMRLLIQDIKGQIY